MSRRNIIKTETTASPNKGAYVYSLSVFILSLLYYLSYYNYGLIQGDWGVIVAGAEKFLEGKVFYRDFGILYTPGIYIYTALFFKLFGISLNSAMIGWSILRVFNCLVIYMIGTKFLSRRLALALPFLLWLVPGPLHKSFFVFFLLLNIYLLLQMLSQKKRLIYFVSGVLISITAIFRVDLFGFAGITLFFVELVKIISTDHEVIFFQKLKISLSNLTVFGVGIIIGFAPGIYYLYSNSAFLDAYNLTIAYSSVMKELWFEVPPVDQLLALDYYAIQKYLGVSSTIIFYLFLLVIIGAVIVSRDYKDFNERDKKFLVVILFGCMTINQTLMYPGVARVSVVLAPVLIADLYLITRFFERRMNLSIVAKRVYSTSLIGLNFMLASFIVLSCSMSDEFINGSFSIRFSKDAFIDAPKVRVYTTEEYADNFVEIMDVIEELTDEGEYIFNFPGTYLMYHFATDRKALDKYGIIAEYMMSKERQLETITQLEEKNIRLIITELNLEIQKREKWAPIVNEYILKHYEPKHTIGRISIFMRKEA